jgi:hypothetical protein
MPTAVIGFLGYRYTLLSNHVLCAVLYVITITLFQLNLATTLLIGFSCLRSEDHDVEVKVTW